METVYLNGDGFYVNSFQVNMHLYFIAFWYSVNTQLMGKIGGGKSGENKVNQNLNVQRLWWKLSEFLEFSGL